MQNVKNAVKVNRKGIKAGDFVKLSPLAEKNTNIKEVLLRKYKWPAKVASSTRGAVVIEKDWCNTRDYNPNIFSVHTDWISKCNPSGVKEEPKVDNWKGGLDLLK